MNSNAIEEAAAHLVKARQAGRPLSRLPDSCQPQTLDDANAIQDAVARQLKTSVAGWKASYTPAAGLLYGAIIKPVTFQTPAQASVKVLFGDGVEGEIAFRFERALPAAARDYTRQEVADAVSVMPAIEVVGTRYENPKVLSVAERAADFNSNGGFVTGAAIKDWQKKFDLAALEVKFAVDGKTIMQRIGGHPSGDPLGPVVALANHMRLKTGVTAGQIVTTGACSGLHHVEPGKTTVVTFAQLGTVELTLRP